MAALKTLVIVLGLAIVGMVGLIGWAVTKRFAGPAPDGPLAVSLGLPAGATIIGAVPADGQLAVTFRLADGTVRVTVLDLATGQPVATVGP